MNSKHDYSNTALTLFKNQLYLVLRRNRKFLNDEEYKKFHVILDAVGNSDINTDNLVINEYGKRKIVIQP
jgi:hypothetical protein